MKQILKKWLLSFDNKDETGFDYKKLTAFWGVIVSTGLILAYCLKEIKVFWFGVSVVVKDELPEFKWILGIVLTFILVLVYFTNYKSLQEFLSEFKDYAKKNNSDTGGA
jgi:hypothetical protein